MAVFTLPKNAEFADNLLARGTDVLANDQYITTVLNSPNLTQANIDPAMAATWTSAHIYTNGLKVSTGNNLYLSTGLGTFLQGFSDTELDLYAGNVNSLSVRPALVSVNSVADFAVQVGKKIYLDTSTTTGIYSVSLGTIDFLCNNLNPLVLSSNLVNVTSNADLIIQATRKAYFRDTGNYISSDAANQLSFFTNSLRGFYLNSAAKPFFEQHGTTASASNVFIDSGTGELLRSTSARRYKTKIKKLEVDTAKIYDLKPVSYSDKKTKKRFFGLIAEDVDKILPELVQKNPITKKCENVTYDRLSVLLLAEIQKLRKEVDSLKREKKSAAKNNAVTNS